jgi:hypothetical protein
MITKGHLTLWDPVEVPMFNSKRAIKNMVHGDMLCTCPTTDGNNIGTGGEEANDGGEHDEAGDDEEQASSPSGSLRAGGVRV